MMKIKSNMYNIFKQSVLDYDLSVRKYHEDINNVPLVKPIFTNDLIPDIKEYLDSLEHDILKDEILFIIDHFADIKDKTLLCELLLNYPNMIKEIKQDIQMETQSYEE